MKILTLSQNREKSVLWIGFTDNVGNPTQNITLSTQRAANIQSEFAKFGVKTETFGFGQALPIASNASSPGQNKNRRVEVWLK
jgi:phosphate transport system substrate-binding protein